ncbi:ABC transporter permease [Labrys wisconsinensis]|uniref:Autoinducer 2 import system permease protein LsrD n=1 Tax=Labrys wisconsinensis TaxID=425677 RepID=A0ABU0JCE9_9HYPH|nr:ABC transporter permease [Labrys wisconsinensis]MDQ0471953.1 ribose transport system permease protein [Labrys wisconsinensis]
MLRTVLAKPWIWSFLAAVAAWLATLAVSGGQGGGQILTAAFSFSAFTVLVSLGQMLVITTGPGNVDLSIPSVIALSSAVSMLVMNEDPAMIVPGLLAAVLAGLAVGACNFGLIRLLRIPPIIATLSSSLVVMSIAIVNGRGLKIKPPQLFSDLVTAKLFGVPLLAAVALIAAVLVALALERTVYGRSVGAVGQNDRAAQLAGFDVERTRFITYALSGGLAGLTGALIAGFSGGNSLDQGEEYLLLTIAVVVIGGTSVAGGRASVPGVWGAALFMFLVVTMLNAAGADPGVRLLLTGLIIIAVITLAGGEKTIR